MKCFFCLQESKFYRVTCIELLGKNAIQLFFCCVSDCFDWIDDDSSCFPLIVYSTFLMQLDRSSLMYIIDFLYSHSFMIKDYSSFRCIKSDTRILKLDMMKHQVVVFIVFNPLLHVHVWHWQNSPHQSHNITNHETLTCVRILCSQWKARCSWYKDDQFVLCESH